jgi:hypothetical protein
MVKNIFGILKRDFKLALIAILFAAVAYLFYQYVVIVNSTTKPCTEELQELRGKVLDLQEMRLKEAERMNALVDSLKDQQRKRERELDSLIYILKSKVKSK